MGGHRKKWVDARRQQGQKCTKLITSYKEVGGRSPPPSTPYYTSERETDRQTDRDTDTDRKRLRDRDIQAVKYRGRQKAKDKEHEG